MYSILPKFHDLNLVAKDSQNDAIYKTLDVISRYVNEDEWKEELEDFIWWVEGEYGQDGGSDEELQPLLLDPEDMAEESARMIPVNFREVISSINSQQQAVIQSDEYYMKMRLGEPIRYPDEIYGSLSTLVGMLRCSDSLDDIRAALVLRGIFGTIMDLHATLEIGDQKFPVVLEAICVFLPEDNAIKLVMKNRRLIGQLIEIIKSQNKSNLGYATHIFCLLTAVDDIAYELNHPKYHLIEALINLLKKNDCSNVVSNNVTVSLLRLCSFSPQSIMGLKITNERLKKMKLKRQLLSGESGSEVVDRKDSVHIRACGPSNVEPMTLESPDLTNEIEANFSDLTQYGTPLSKEKDSVSGAVMSVWVDPDLVLTLLNLLGSDKTSPALIQAIVSILCIIADDSSVAELIMRTHITKIFFLFDEFLDSIKSAKRHFELSNVENPICNHANPSDILVLIRVMARKSRFCLDSLMNNGIVPRLVHLLRQSIYMPIKMQVCALIYLICSNGPVYSEPFLRHQIVEILTRLIIQVPNNSLSNTLQYYYVGLLKLFVKLHPEIHARLTSRYFLITILERATQSMNPLLLRYVVEILSLILNGKSSQNLEFIIDDNNELKEMLKNLTKSSGEIGDLFYGLCLRLNL